jgi:hypothetical protein
MSTATLIASLFFGNMQVERYEGNGRDQNQEDESGVCTTIKRNHLHRRCLAGWARDELHGPVAEACLATKDQSALNAAFVRSSGWRRAGLTS